jgi:hypothetical protein
MIFCDNKSLIKRINERRSTRITVNQHNYADIDLVLQIIEEIRTLREDEKKYNTSIRKTNAHDCG